MPILESFVDLLKSFTEYLEDLAFCQIKKGIWIYLFNLLPIKDNKNSLNHLLRHSKYVICCFLTITILFWNPATSDQLSASV